jgi:hypothetical protein
MQRILWPCLLLGAQVLAAPALAAPTVERLVFIRHGEKPPHSLGQLTCQGLNRALALPPVLIGKYGKPDYIFAPDPRQEAVTGTVVYDYVRPLATIEPTAIQLGMPVNTQYNTYSSKQMEAHLLESKYAQSLVFIAWEHNLMEYMVRDIVARFGVDPSVVPAWTNSDYDSLYVIDITREGGKAAAQFRRDHEGLDGQSPLCPAEQGAQARITTTAAPVPAAKP